MIAMGHEIQKLLLKYGKEYFRNVHEKELKSCLTEGMTVH